MNDLLKVANEQKSKSIESLNEQLVQLDKSLQSKAAQFDSMLAEAEAKRDEEKNRGQDLLNKVATLQSRLDAADDLLARYGLEGDGDVLNGADGAAFSSTAATLSRIQKSGKTFTEVVSDRNGV
jgi:hypothetical protein